MQKAFDIGFGRTQQEISLEALPVQGSIPEWLEGDLIRNGPGTFHVGDEHYRHWFDGLAMLHRFSFRKGRVDYQNKYLECKAYHEAMEKNRIAYSEFATDPCFSIFDRFKAIFHSPMTDSAKVSIAQIADKVLALSETPMQIQFDRDTLKSLGVFNYDSKVNRHVTTVHPQIDKKLGKDYNITTRFSRISQYRLLEIRESQDPAVVATLPAREVSYMHSFGMSPDYFIITEFPFMVNPLSILFSGKPFIENYRWKPERGTIFYIIDRRTGSLVKKLTTDAFFAFHHVNAFEKDGLLYVDIVCYPDAGIIDAFYLDRIKEEKQVLPVGAFRRYRIDLEAGRMDYETLGDEGMELPRYDEDAYHMDGQYRYVYGVGVNREHPQSFYNQLVKLDLHDRTTDTWYEEGAYPGEGIFIGKPGRKNEDEGVLLSVVLNDQEETSFLLVLDAATMKEIGRAAVPHAILFGYHGAYLT
jgi:carotenoid cleavage dioxygenase-like enzyme